MNWEKLLAENFANAVPEGYETTRQIAKRWNCRVDSAASRLNKLFEKGLVDKKEAVCDGHLTNSWKIK
jgi:predicted transcriptional regulator